jgi:hypothetical protein
MTGLQCRGDLLDRLTKLDGLIAGQKATLALLELERLRLRSELAAAGHRLPVPETRK